jgi:hypothetical protein
MFVARASAHPSINTLLDRPALRGFDSSWLWMALNGFGWLGMD